MLRIERIFEEDASAEEPATYSPLIPDGCNWKATFMIEFTDPLKWRVALMKMPGIEDKLWMQVEHFRPLELFVNEDNKRTTDEKTSAVHFVRFELDDKMIEALQAGTGLAAGIAYFACTYKVQVASSIVASSLKDLHPGAPSK